LCGVCVYISVRVCACDCMHMYLIMLQSQPNNVFTQNADASWSNVYF